MEQAGCPGAGASYPEARMFGRLPSYGFYAVMLQVCGSRMFSVTSKVPDPRPLLTCDDVEHLELNRIGGTSAGPGQALLDLRNARNVFVHGCVAPPETAVFCRIAGEGSQDVTLLANELARRARR